MKIMYRILLVFVSIQLMLSSIIFTGRGYAYERELPVVTSRENINKAALPNLDDSIKNSVVNVSEESLNGSNHSGIANSTENTAERKEKSNLVSENIGGEDNKTAPSSDVVEKDTHKNYDDKVRPESEPVMTRDGKVFMKVINKNGEYLSGAFFEMTDETGIFKIEKSTDKEGKLVYDGLKEGTYFLAETKAPDGYEISNTRWKVIVYKNFKTEVVQIKNNIMTKEYKDSTVEMTYLKDFFKGKINIEETNHKLNMTDINKESKNQQGDRDNENKNKTGADDLDGANKTSSISGSISKDIEKDFLTEKKNHGETDDINNIAGKKNLFAEDILFSAKKTGNISDMSVLNSNPIEKVVKIIEKREADKETDNKEKTEISSETGETSANEDTKNKDSQNKINDVEEKDLGLGNTADKSVNDEVSKSEDTEKTNTEKTNTDETSARQENSTDIKNNKNTTEPVVDDISDNESGSYNVGEDTLIKQEGAYPLITLIQQNFTGEKKSAISRDSKGSLNIDFQIKIYPANFNENEGSRYLSSDYCVCAVKREKGIVNIIDSSRINGMAFHNKEENEASLYDLKIQIKEEKYKKYIKEGYNILVIFDPMQYDYRTFWEQSKKYKNMWMGRDNAYEFKISNQGESVDAEYTTYKLNYIDEGEYTKENKLRDVSNDSAFWNPKDFKKVGSNLIYTILNFSDITMKVDFVNENDYDKKTEDRKGNLNQNDSEFYRKIPVKKFKYCFVTFDEKQNTDDESSVSQSSDLIYEKRDYGKNIENIEIVDKHGKKSNEIHESENNSDELKIKRIDYLKLLYKIKNSKSGNSNNKNCGIMVIPISENDDNLKKYYKDNRFFIIKGLDQDYEYSADNSSDKMKTSLSEKIYDDNMMNIMKNRDYVYVDCTNEKGEPISPESLLNSKTENITYNETAVKRYRFENKDDEKYRDLNRLFISEKEDLFEDVNLKKVEENTMTFLSGAKFKIMIIAQKEEGGKVVFSKADGILDEYSNKKQSEKEYITDEFGNLNFRIPKEKLPSNQSIFLYEEAPPIGHINDTNILYEIHREKNTLYLQAINMVVSDGAKNFIEKIEKGENVEYESNKEPFRIENDRALPDSSHYINNDEISASFIYNRKKDYSDNQNIELTLKIKYKINGNDIREGNYSSLINIRDYYKNVNNSEPKMVQIGNEEKIEENKFKPDNIRIDLGKFDKIEKRGEKIYAIKKVLVSSRYLSKNNSQYMTPSGYNNIVVTISGELYKDKFKQGEMKINMDTLEGKIEYIDPHKDLGINAYQNKDLQMYEKSVIKTETLKREIKGNSVNFSEGSFYFLDIYLPSAYSRKPEDLILPGILIIAISLICIYRKKNVI